MSSDAKSFFLKKDMSDLLLEEVKTNSLRARYVLKDSLNGIVPSTKEEVSQICELIASYRVIELILDSVFTEENESKEGIYRIDEQVLLGLQSSMSLISVLKLSLESAGFSLVAH